MWNFRELAEISRRVTRIENLALLEEEAAAAIMPGEIRPEDIAWAERLSQINEARQ
jgi:hypothetical protein